MALRSLLIKSNGNTDHASIDLSNQFESRSFMRTALAWRGSITPRIMPRVFYAGVYSFWVVWLLSYFPSFVFSMTPFEYSGIVLGLVLVARVNAGLERWWEARKIWGSIVNQSRNLATIIYQYAPEKSVLKDTLLHWVALWPHTMREQLRGERELNNAHKLIQFEEVTKVAEAKHMPMFVSARIASLLQDMRKEGFDDFAFHRAERERSLLIDAIGACERIKNTPIPLVLAIKTRRFIFLFLLLLPVALRSDLGWLTPFVMCLTAYPLFSLDEIGVELQNPFAKTNLSHLPLDTICKTIEGNVLELKKF